MSNLYQCSLALFASVWLVPLAFSAESSLATSRPSAERVYQLAPADTTMIGVVDGGAFFSTDSVHKLLAHPASASLARLLTVLESDAAFIPARDLSAVYVFAEHDHLSTGMIIAEGNFSGEKLAAYLVRKRNAVRLPAASPDEPVCYRFPLRRLNLYAAFPAQGMAILTGGENKLREALQIIATARGVMDRAQAGWFEDEKDSITTLPVNLYFKDLGAFVGGLQPFALVGKAQAATEEKAGKVISVFAAELPDSAGADQFIKLLTVLQQLFTSYCKSNGKTLSTQLLDSVELQSTDNNAYVRASAAIDDILKAVDEFYP